MGNTKNNYRWSKGKIDGVIIKPLVKYPDRRGFLCETFRLEELRKPVMSYISYTEPGITRGPTNIRNRRIFFVRRTRTC